MHRDDQGQILSETLLAYALPTEAVVPPVALVSLSTPSPPTPLGIKGVGEGDATAPDACLANAVSDALAPLGAAVNATPLASEAVLRLTQGASQ